jgi:hypothetical protein
MRRTILVVVVVLLALVVVAPSAGTIPKEPKGCPAEASVWTLVEFGQTPYTANSLYTFYFVEHAEAAAAFAEFFGLVLPQDEEAAYILAESIVAPVDRNGDQQVCVWWIGGNPGLPDWYASIVDNNSNAQH